MFRHLVSSILPTRENIGRILIGGYFLISGIQSATGFQALVGSIQGIQIMNKNLPMPQALAAIAIGMKILGGVTLALNIKANWSRWMLIIFLIGANFFAHNPVKDRSQLPKFLTNTAIMGGLLLVE